MGNVKSDWYKYWDLGIKNMSWVEGTKREVDFLIKNLNLSGSERILDLACGFGRHSLEFAKRGFKVVGVDITPAFIEDATKNAQSNKLDADFICSDIRDIDYHEEFDVVLNLADGAIGYLENDEENLKIFDKISSALKPGGKHFMDICNREHAEKYFPNRDWEVGKKTLALADFSWNASEKRMLYWGCDIQFGTVLNPPLVEVHDTGVRLYDKDEISDILEKRNIKIINTYSDYFGTPDSYKRLQLMVYSCKMR